jgi:hypothetical protein
MYEELVSSDQKRIRKPDNCPKDRECSTRIVRMGRPPSVELGAA